MEDDELKRSFYPEANISGFTYVDGMVAFFNQISAIVAPSDIVLDFGAGRGGSLSDDTSKFRRDMQNFKGRCAHVDGCDIDPIVLQNPFLDQAKVTYPGEPLPYEDSRFDVIFARWVFEHIEDPEFIASELMRILKPGGVLAAKTPNKWGYIGIGARLVPNRHHVRVLAQSQPHRKPEDVFPTLYKLNTPKAIRTAFGRQADVYIANKASEPAYHFGKASIYRAVKFVNKHCPDSFLPVIDIFVRKR